MRPCRCGKVGIIEILCATVALIEQLGRRNFQKLKRAGILTSSAATSVAKDNARRLIRCRHVDRRPHPRSPREIIYRRHLREKNQARLAGAAVDDFHPVICPVKARDFSADGVRKKRSAIRHRAVRLAGHCIVGSCAARFVERPVREEPARVIRRPCLRERSAASSDQCRAAFPCSVVETRERPVACGRRSVIKVSPRIADRDCASPDIRRTNREKVQAAGCSADVFTGAPLPGTACGTRGAACECHAVAVRRNRPVAAVAVAELIHDPARSIPQSQRFPAVIELAGKRAERSGNLSRYRCNDNVAATRHDRPGGKRVIDPAVDPPSADVHIDTLQTAQLHPFGLGQLIRGMILQLVKNEHRIRGRRIKSEGEEGQ